MKKEAPTRLTEAQRHKRKLERKKQRFDGGNLRLTAEKIPGYELRWVNDIGTRVKDFEDKGWSLVTDEKVATSDDSGSARVKRVGVKERGAAQKAVLMKIPVDDFEIDQELKEEKIAAVENQIREGVHETEAGNGRYIPKSGIHLKRG